MSKHARILNSVAVDVVTGDPAEFFHPDIAKDFVPVPDQVESDWSVTAGKWSAPTPIEPVAPVAPAPVYPKVSPVQFKLLFTPQERVAIKAARATDPVIDDFYDIVEDVRLTHVDLGLKSTQAAIGYLAQQGLINQSRVSEIMQGQVQ